MMRKPIIEKKTFAEKLASDKFIVSAELTPPVHYDLHEFMQAAEIIKQYVDVIQINDHLLSKARVTNLVAGQECRRAGIDPVLQFTLRHKNRIAIQGDLLGMAASGLRNIIVLSGYPCRIGNDPAALDVTDMQTLEALEKITAFNQKGELFSGETIAPPPSFTIGTIEFPCSIDKLEESMERVEKKIEAGAQFIQIQAVFELEVLELWMAEVVKRDLHNKARFFGAVFPFTNLERLHVLKEIPGLAIPDYLLERVKKNDGESESLAVLLELIQGIRQIKGISGLHIRSIGAENWVPKIIEASGLGGELVY